MGRQRWSHGVSFPESSATHHSPLLGHLIQEASLPYSMTKIWQIYGHATLYNMKNYSLIYYKKSTNGQGKDKVISGQDSDCTNIMQAPNRVIQYYKLCTARAFPPMTLDKYLKMFCACNFWKLFTHQQVQTTVFFSFPSTSWFR